MIKNAFSVDVEDWFSVSNLSSKIAYKDWDNCQLRINQGMSIILELLDKYNTKATFFVLGWIADRARDLIKDIDRGGHELAIHGYSHSLLTKITPEEFTYDLKKAILALKNCNIQQEPIGFRAPSFTIVKNTMWAIDILKLHGFRYDSSVFPIGFHPDYGIADAPLNPYKIAEDFYEFPLSCAVFGGKRFPCAGGGYFRLFPYKYTNYCIKKCNQDNRPVVFYIHPWELDFYQPRISLPISKYIRHYYNLHKTKSRLERLLQDFKFTTIKEVLGI